MSQNNCYTISFQKLKLEKGGIIKSGDRPALYKKYGQDLPFIGRTNNQTEKQLTNLGAQCCEVAVARTASHLYG